MRERGPSPRGKRALFGARKKNGEACKNLAGFLTTHPGTGPCKWHGGSVPNAAKRAALVVAKAEVGVLIPEVPDDQVKEMAHIKEALRESISRLRGWHRYMAKLAPEDLATLAPEHRR